MGEKIVCRVLTGPTASGKTEISLHLAEKHGWEIACMDSMQVYRGMDIGTAKPTAAEQKRVRHHLLDLCDPADSFSVALYREYAESLIRKKWEEERKEILFVGGTGLYLQSLIHPMGMGSVPADQGLRCELWKLLERSDGKEKLHQILQEMDPITADRLPLNDIRRTIRAIEVCKATGIPFSLQPARETASDFSWRVTAINMPRDRLYSRINQRVEHMIEYGLVQEVQELVKEGISPECQSMQALGYKEMLLYLNGEWTIEKTKEEIQKRTRHYAKRQETFLRREREVRFINSETADLVVQAEKALD